LDKRKGFVLFLGGPVFPLAECIEQIPIGEAPDPRSLSARIDAIADSQATILFRLDELQALWR
jgi:hypothetical protein